MAQPILENLWCEAPRYRRGDESRGRSADAVFTLSYGAVPTRRMLCPRLYHSRGSVFVRLHHAACATYVLRLSHALLLVAAGGAGRSKEEAGNEIHTESNQRDLFIH
jgi:hypothetical protein